MADKPYRSSQRSNADRALGHYLEEMADKQKRVVLASRDAKPDDDFEVASGVSARLADKPNLPQEPLISQSIDEKQRQAERLLQQANDRQIVMEADILAKAAEDYNALKNSLNDKENPALAETIEVDQTRDPLVPLEASLPARFQVLLCEVAGLTIAVPLVELGGIHQLTKISKLAGKPDWFKGILIKGENKYQCIDAARWIMPEKFSAEMAENIDYKFAIQLGKTPYLLCCESVSSTIELTKDDIKWRSEDLKRPWLAGLLKEKMCALIDSARMVQVVLNTPK